MLATALQLTSEMYYKDDASSMDAFRTREDGGQLQNAGHLVRRAHVKLSRKFDMIGHMHADIFFPRTTDSPSPRARSPWGPTHHLWREGMAEEGRG